MPKFTVCRTFATRHRWTVEAKDAAEAYAMLDDNDQTPSELADEEWLGPVHSQAVGELQDNCIDANGNEV